MRTSAPNGPSSRLSTGRSSNNAAASSSSSSNASRPTRPSRPVTGQSSSTSSRVGQSSTWRSNYEWRQQDAQVAASYAASRPSRSAINSRRGGGGGGGRMSSIEAEERQRQYQQVLARHAEAHGDGDGGDDGDGVSSLHSQHLHRRQPDRFLIDENRPTNPVASSSSTQRRRDTLNNYPSVHSQLVTGTKSTTPSYDGYLSSPEPPAMRGGFLSGNGGAPFHSQSPFGGGNSSSRVVYQQPRRAYTPNPTNTRSVVMNNRLVHEGASIPTIAFTNSGRASALSSPMMAPPIPGSPFSALNLSSPQPGMSSLVLDGTFARNRPAQDTPPPQHQHAFSSSSSSTASTARLPPRSVSATPHRGSMYPRAYQLLHQQHAQQQQEQQQQQEMPSMLSQIDTAVPSSQPSSSRSTQTTSRSTTKSLAPPSASARRPVRRPSAASSSSSGTSTSTTRASKPTASSNYHLRAGGALPTHSRHTITSTAPRTSATTRTTTTSATTNRTYPLGRNHPTIQSNTAAAAATSDTTQPTSAQPTSADSISTPTSTRPKTRSKAPASGSSSTTTTNRVGKPTTSLQMRRAFV